MPNKMYHATAAFEPKSQTIAVTVHGISRAHTIKTLCREFGVENTQVINTKDGTLSVTIDLPDGKTASTFIRALETREENGKLIEVMKFSNPNKLYRDVEAAEKLRTEKQGTEFHISQLEDGVMRVTLTQFPPDSVETFADIMQTIGGRISPLPNMVEVKDGTVQIDFACPEDVLTFYNALKTRIKLAHQPHEVVANVDGAARTNNIVFDVVPKKTGIYVTFSNAPKDIGKVLMPVLSNVPLRTDMVIGDDGAITVSFNGGHDIKTVYNKLEEKGMVFSEDKQVIYRKINDAATQCHEWQNPRQ